PEEVKPATSKLAPGQVFTEDATRNAARSASAASAPARVAPLAPGRFALQISISQHLHDPLRRAQESLAHARPGRAVARTTNSRRNRSTARASCARSAITPEHSGLRSRRVAFSDRAPASQFRKRPLLPGGSCYLLGHDTRPRDLLARLEHP